MTVSVVGLKKWQTTRGEPGVTEKNEETDPGFCVKTTDQPMDKFFRFSDYDVFAYLTAGFAGLAVVDLSFSTSFIVGASWTFSAGTLTVFAAYILGHIIAIPSSSFIEHGLVKRFLGAPSENLLADNQSGLRWLMKVTTLRDFYRPLTVDIQARVMGLANPMSGVALTGERLFWVAFAAAKRDPSAAGRMQTFLNLYGFCRNIAFVGLFGGALIAVFGTSPETTRNAVIAVATGVLMLHRYLKFYRLYCVEVFVSFAGNAKQTDGNVK